MDATLACPSCEKQMQRDQLYGGVQCPHCGYLKTSVYAFRGPDEGGRLWPVEIVVDGTMRYEVGEIRASMDVPATLGNLSGLLRAVAEELDKHAAELSQEG